MNDTSDIGEIILDNISSMKNMKKARDAIWSAYYDDGITCENQCGEDLKILILNAPCHGFGDLIFAIKIARYLREWYGAKVTIATPLLDGLIKMGEKKENAVLLTTSVKKSGASDCRRFRLLKLARKLPKQDLIFVAPVQANFDPKFSDIKYLLPYSNKLNTFMFSEYNDSSRKHFDFATGVGGKRYGLLLTDIPPTKKTTKIKGPYALAYIASSGSVDRADTCLIAFLEMIAKKYGSKSKKFEVVVPAWVNEDIYDMRKRLIAKLSPYVTHIEFIGKESSKTLYTENNDHVFVLRADILPVPNEEMLSLMKHSVDDILLTGDQSITDAMSCCSRKNIFYQIAPWKENFGKNLAKLMPNKYLHKKTTSCGTIHAISYKSNYGKFVKEWDFRERAKPKLDAIVLSALAMRKKGEIQNISKAILESRTLNSLKKKLDL